MKLRPDSAREVVFLLVGGIVGCGINNAGELLSLAFVI